MIETSRFSNAWRDYKRRRRWLMLCLGSFVLALLLDWKVAADFGVLWGIAYLFFAYRHLFFRCPRCRKFFFLKFPANNPFAQRCLHCGLPKWSSDASEKEISSDEKGRGRNAEDGKIDLPS